MQKYSVLMSVYDKESPENLESSLKSMLDQTVYPEEIIVVEDGPLNKKLKMVINKLSSENPNIIKTIPLEKNVGLGKALDIGIEYCKYELIARMDSDDISLPNRCELQLKRFNSNPNLVLLGTMIDEFYDDPNKIISSRVVPTEYSAIKKFMRRRSPFNHPTVMYKKSAVKAVGGYGEMKRKQDLDLFSRMINRGYHAENLSESLLLFRSNRDNYRRRKSWSYCKSYIDVQLQIFKRGHCTLIDFLYVLITQMIIYIIPYKLWVFVSDKLLRKNNMVKEDLYEKTN